MAFRGFRIGGLQLLAYLPPKTARQIRTAGGLLGDSAQQGPSDRGLEPRPDDHTIAAPPGSLAERVAAIEWYHTIDLGGGVVTPGWFDLRPILGRYPIPERLDGMRVLDVATFDGFWAFEFERRGAAEVVALDIDSFAEVDMTPRIRRQKSAAYLAQRTGLGFKLAAEALRSRVQRVSLNVYDLSPEKLGKFDMVFISDVLLHLMNPMKALANVCSVTGGKAVIVDVYNPVLPARLMSYESGETHNTWWDFSFGALEQMIWDAGFSSVDLHARIPLGYQGARAVLSQAAFVARP
ncbi:MAG: methyltransferase domain-containing protein [Rhodocyclaceae bacterium]|nr:methyltransferase domain-containing protein [Rhodocyclaceae bacterium]